MPKKSSTNANVHPYLKKENWDWGGQCCFFEQKDHPNYKDREKLHKALMDLEFDPRGVLLTVNRNIRNTTRN